MSARGNSSSSVKMAISSRELTLAVDEAT